MSGLDPRVLGWDWEKKIWLEDMRVPLDAPMDYLKRSG